MKTIAAFILVAICAGMWGHIIGRSMHRDVVIIRVPSPPPTIHL